MIKNDKRREYMKKNPYTLMFGQQPTQSIPRLVQVSEVVSSFVAEPFNPNLYMVTGLRGCGKTVFMTEVEKEIKKLDNWIVVELNSSGKLLTDLAASLASEDVYAQMFQKAKINLSFFGIGLEVEGSVAITSIQVAVTKMLEVIKKHDKRVLVCIDEATPSEEMKLFAGSYQILIRQDLPISLIMTGLPKNIDSLQNVDNLTFLYRAPRVFLPPLNLNTISENYRNILGVSHEDSQTMAKLTRGYSFAFQVLGYFTWEEENRDYNKALSKVRGYLEDSVYVKIWSEMSNGDKRFISGVVNSGSGKAEEIKRITKLSNSEYSVYRSRMIKSGLINGGDHGYVKITLPFFEEFVRSNMFFES